ncbi:unnamed protein product [Ixodes persulcatus]
MIVPSVSPHISTSMLGAWASLHGKETSSKVTSRLTKKRSSFWVPACTASPLLGSRSVCTPLLSGPTCFPCIVCFADSMFCTRTLLGGPVSLLPLSTERLATLLRLLSMSTCF